MLFLREHPGEYETTRIILGHKSLDMTVRSYCGLEQADALRRFDALIDRHRNKPEPPVTHHIRRSLTADWPAPDRALWENGIAPKGLFESGGAGASGPSAPGANGSRLRPLAVVACNRGALRPDLGPADRVTEERVTAFVARLRAERAPYTVLCRVQELYDALRAMAPEAEWGWLARLYYALKARARPTRDKASRLRSIDELVALGERLMDEAEIAPDWSARRRAVAIVTVL